jgi:hypothetical protein
MYLPDARTGLLRATLCKILTIDVISNRTTIEIPEHKRKRSLTCDHKSLHIAGLFEYLVDPTDEKLNNNNMYRHWEQMILKMYSKWEVGIIKRITPDILYEEMDECDYQSYDCPKSYNCQEYYECGAKDNIHHRSYSRIRDDYAEFSDDEDRDYDFHFNMSTNECIYERRKNRYEAKINIRYQQRKTYPRWNNYSNVYYTKQITVSFVSCSDETYNYDEIGQHSYDFPNLRYPKNEIHFDRSIVGKYVIRPPLNDDTVDSKTTEPQPSKYCLLLDTRLEQLLDAPNRCPLEV